MFDLRFTASARLTFEEIKRNPSQAGLLKQLRKTLSFMQTNLRHTSLRTHEFHDVPHPFSSDEKVFEAYAQNQTPGAYRVLWCYGPEKKQITIIAITPHP